MIIKKIEKNDLPGMAKLYKGFWNEDSDLNKMNETFSEIENNPNYLIYNAFINEEIIGTILGIICNSFYGQCDPFLVIEDFIVSEKHRRKGVGKKLLETIEKDAKQKGCNQVILVTDVKRKGSQMFYESCGFSAGKNVGYKKKI